VEGFGQCASAVRVWVCSMTSGLSVAMLYPTKCAAF
jgi:hypothetical protein